MSNAFPASSVTAGIEARAAPDAPVKTKPGSLSMLVHVGTFSSQLPAAPESARDDMGSPKIGVLWACLKKMTQQKRRLIQTEEWLRRPIM